MKVYFSDVFNVSEEVIEEYGAFNISLINDLPLFVDPFLLFGNGKEEYLQLHNGILDYLIFLKEKAESGVMMEEEIKLWYVFSEVKQNWFGYSKTGNKGSGLGMKFGHEFSSSVPIVFADLGEEMVTETSHLEKAALFEEGVGRDSISDFTTNLIKDFLLSYTEGFAKEHVDPSLLKRVMVDRVYFDYVLESWMPKEFLLPYYSDDFVILTPKDILTKDETWINKEDLYTSFLTVTNSIENDTLRYRVQKHFHEQLRKRVGDSKPKKKDTESVVRQTIRQFPEVIDWYIKYKEETKHEAKNVSQQKVEDTMNLFVENVGLLVSRLQIQTDFYRVEKNSSLEEAKARVDYLKDIIENKDGYKLFYVKGKPVSRESDLHIMFRLVWYGSGYDVNREANNGRGSADFLISKGSADKTVVEFKLAKSSSLKRNLANQLGVYARANDTENTLMVILYFNDKELERVYKAMNELNMSDAHGVVLIDASEKVSASRVE